VGGALVIGLIAGLACLWGVNGLKKLLGADDSLDVFGVHGVGGIVGALLTGVFNTRPWAAPALVADWVTATVRSSPTASARQVWIQAKAWLMTIVWSGRGLAGRLQDRRPDDRPARPEEEEREGLDITSHGETAYSK
jgi:Amt family ammonium transporter